MGALQHAFSLSKLLPKRKTKGEKIGMNYGMKVKGVKLRLILKNLRNLILHIV